MRETAGGEPLGSKDVILRYDFQMNNPIASTFALQWPVECEAAFTSPDCRYDLVKAAMQDLSSTTVAGTLPAAGPTLSSQRQSQSTLICRGPGSPPARTRIHQVYLTWNERLSIKRWNPRFRYDSGSRSEEGRELGG